MARPRQLATPLVRDDVDDLIREASAMTMLYSTSPEYDSDALTLVTRRARNLYARSQSSRNRQGYREGVPPTREELDELWALVPERFLPWAHRIVDRLIGVAREHDTIATPQTFECELDDRGQWRIVKHGKYA